MAKVKDLNLCFPQNQDTVRLSFLGTKQIQKVVKRERGTEPPYWKPGPKSTLLGLRSDQMRLEAGMFQGAGGRVRYRKKEGANMPIKTMLAPGRRNGGGFFLNGSTGAGVGSLILYLI